MKFIGTEIIETVGELASEFVEDKDKTRELENNLHLGQIEVNKIEAASTNLFVAGWRPAIGWVGAAALAYTVILAPMLSWGAAVYAGTPAPLPAVDPEYIMYIVMGLLGLGGMRTVEKTKGVATPYRETRQEPEAVPKPAKPKSRWFK